MSKANKKQRHEAKRKAKRLASRRQEAISPVKRLADTPGDLECWISEAFETTGQMQAFVYKRAGGLAGVVAFLLDRGVVGLKDTFARMELDRSEFENILQNARQSGIKMRPSSPDEIRRWVAGGLRWAHDNGMRLPKDWAKCAVIIGGVGDWQSADVSGFVKEFVGHPEDLRQRLVGEPFESYLQRKDIDFEFSTNAPYMDQKTGRYSDWDKSLEDMSEEELESSAADIPNEELNEIAKGLVPKCQALAGKTTTWLEAGGEKPSPELAEAWSSTLLGVLLANAAMPNADAKEVGEFSVDLIDSMASRVEASRVMDYHRAMEQVRRHLAADNTIIQNVLTGKELGR